MYRQQSWEIEDEMALRESEDAEQARVLRLNEALDAVSSHMDDRIDWLMLAVECLAQASDRADWRPADQRIARDIEARIEDAREDANG